MENERKVEDAKGGDEPDCYLKVRPDVRGGVGFLPCDAGEPWMSEDGMVVEVTPWGSDEPITVHANRTVHPPHAPDEARVLKRVRLPPVNPKAVLEGIDRIGRRARSEADGGGGS